MSDNRNTANGTHVERIQRKWLLFALAGVIVLVVVILLVVLLTGRESGDGSLTTDAADSGLTEVTSPYDFTELPLGSGPGDAADASYVSILLVDDTGQVTSYGLNADMPAAKALKTAVHEAEEVDGDLLLSLTTAAPNAPDTQPALSSTLTFVFPDRTTLTFDLYVEHGLVARNNRAWQVEGDLPQLIEAAVSAGGG